MSDKQALRDLQTRLAERLQQVRHEPRGLSWLAFAAGGLNLLVPLQQAGEIFESGQPMPVPHTRPWLRGVVNLRGNVYTVVDLARFLGVAADAEPAAQERGQLLSFNAQLGVNAALGVDRLLGLRHASDMQPETASNAAARPPFARQRWLDAEGRHWQELNLAELAQTPDFLAISA